VYPSSDSPDLQQAAPAPRKPLPRFDVVARREQEPSDTNPLIYREVVYSVALGTSEELADALLLDRVDELRRTLEGMRSGKLIRLAVFDHTFQGRPRRQPIATLTWKDWRPDPEIAHPLREGAAKPASTPPEPAKPEPAKPAPNPQPAKAQAPAPKPTPPPKPAAAAAPKPASAAAPAPKPASAPAPKPAAAPAPKPASAAAPKPAAAPAPKPASAAAPAPKPAAAPAPATTEAAVPAQKPEPAKPAPKPEPAKPEPPAPKPEPAKPEPPAPKPELAKAKPAAPKPEPPKPEAPKAKPAPEPKQPEAKPAAPARLGADDLISELFEACVDLHFLNDSIEGAEFILKLTLAKIPSAVGLVSLFDINRREFVLVRQTGGQIALLARLSERAPVAQAAMRSRAAVVVADVAADSRFAGDERWRQIGVEPRSLICAPAELGGRYLGLIEIADPLDGGRYTEAEGNALTYIGQQLAEFVSDRGVIVEPDLVLEGTDVVPPSRRRGGR
jgi:hypothetical protein